MYKQKALDAYHVNGFILSQPVYPQSETALVNKELNYEDLYEVKAKDKGKRKFSDCPVVDKMYQIYVFKYREMF